MKISLTENGICVPNVKLLEFAENAIKQGIDVEIGNNCLFDAFRLVAKRQSLYNLKWFIYGCEVKMDKDLKFFWPKNVPEPDCNILYELI